MTQPKLPSNIVAAAKSGAVVLLKELAPLLGKCENCAGLGSIQALVAESGPFKDPPLIAKGQIMTSVSDPMYGWVWYAGKSIAGTCPVCNGMKQVKVGSPVRQFKTGAPVKQLAKEMTP